MIFTGKALKLGDNVNTDLLFPSEAILLMGQHLNDPAAYQANLRLYGLKNLGISQDALEQSSFVVAGEAMGCGSSRQFAAEVLKSWGIKGVIAESIHPIFFRNLWNIGLFAIENPGITQRVQDGDLLEVQVLNSIIVNRNSEMEWTLDYRLPPWLLHLITAQGLYAFMENRVGNGKPA